MKRRVLIAAAVLVLAVLALYWPLTRYGLIRFDDGVYVSDNPHVWRGLRLAEIRWAFTSFHAGFWIPITWLSYMADVELFGASAGGMHLTNIILHAANAVLLLLFLWRATGTLLAGLAAAALFAVHPLHVESVAWVTERKDVLSTFFWLWCLLAYLRYARAPRAGTYAPLPLLFALGLASKPMLVTLPAVLLLLDWWPLGRIRGMPGGGVNWRTLLAEKAPLAAVSLLFAGLTVWAHRAGEALAPLREYGLTLRLGNALYSYVRYLGFAAWPRGLAVYYPHPGSSLAAWDILASGAALALLTALAFRAARRLPYLPVGWLWYLVTLFPVMGLLQAGGQGMADRFVYIPLMGIYLALAWGLGDLSGRLPHGRALLAAAAAAAFLALALLTRFQVGLWRDTETLFRHTLRVTGESSVILENLGIELGVQGRTKEAEEMLRRVLKLTPFDPGAHYNLGNVLAREGRLREAKEAYGEALRLFPAHLMARFSRALVESRLGEHDAAVEDYREAVRLEPDFAEARYQMGVTLAQRGDLEAAAGELSEALRLRPDYAEAHYNLGAVLEAMGYHTEARRHMAEAERLKPGLGAAVPPGGGGRP